MTHIQAAVAVQGIGAVCLCICILRLLRRSDEPTRGTARIAALGLALLLSVFLFASPSELQSAAGQCWRGAVGHADAECPVLVRNQSQ